MVTGPWGLQTELNKNVYLYIIPSTLCHHCVISELKYRHIYHICLALNIDIVM